MEVISRESARAAGLTHYFTGTACRNGHIAERRVSSRNCVECGRALVRAYREANAEKLRAQKRAFYEANREKVLERWRAYYEANAEKLRAQSRAFYEANREKVLERMRGWHEANREKARARRRAYYEANAEKLRAQSRAYRKTPEGRAARNALQAARHALKLKATPRWLTPEHKQQMRAIYEGAAARGWEVDHIVPLKGGNVCGLHVPWNLRALPEWLNVARGNRLTAMDVLAEKYGDSHAMACAEFEPDLLQAA